VIKPATHHANGAQSPAPARHDGRQINGNPAGADLKNWPAFARPWPRRDLSGDKPKGHQTARQQATQTDTETSPIRLLHFLLHFVLRTETRAKSHYFLNLRVK